MLQKQMRRVCASGWQREKSKTARQEALKVEVEENSDDIGVGKGIREFIEEGKQTLQRLSQSLQGAKLDALILFIATAVVTPLFKAMKKSPILGFLLTCFYLLLC